MKHKKNVHKDKFRQRKFPDAPSPVGGGPSNQEPCYITPYLPECSG